MDKILLSSEEAMRICEGICNKPWQAYFISIDSRSVKKGDLFLALKGENFDGHNFIAQAFENGAAAAVAEFQVDDLSDEFPVLIVKDSFKALYDLARSARLSSAAKIVGVTGSLGKTTIKEMISLMSSSLEDTYYSKGNFNNHYGLPLSLANMHKDYKYGIFELGMNHFGEIDNLTKLLKPNIAIISCIAEAHLGNFTSIEDIALAKSEIFNSDPAPEIAILNIDDPMFQILKKHTQKKGVKKIISFGSNQNADFKLCEYNEEDHFVNIKIEIYGEEFSYILGMGGRHNVYNSICALAAIYSLGLDINKAVLPLKEAKALKGRGSISNICFASGEKFILIDDTYNASITSIEMAIESAIGIKKRQKGRLIVVLADVLELGEFSEKLHSDLAYKILCKDIDSLFVTGVEMKKLYEIVVNKIYSNYFPNVELLTNSLKDFISPGDIVLVKASNAMNMKYIIDYFNNSFDR